MPVSARGHALRVLALPRRYLLILALGLVASWLVAQTPLYREIARWMGDTILAVTAERVRFEDVLVVDIDESAMAALEPEVGAWPYPRRIYVPVLEHLMAAGVRAVVFDVLFAERRTGDGAFAASLARHERVFLAARGQGFRLPRSGTRERRLEALAWPLAPALPAETWQDLLLPTPALTAGARAVVGVISVKPDDDGVLRRISPLHRVGALTFPAMPVAALYPTGERPAVAAGGGALAVGRHRWPVDAGGRVLLRVPRNRDFVRVVRFDRLLSAARGAPDPELAAGRLRGRTVFIGSSAAVLGDYARLPIHGRTAGLGILALAYASLANDRVLHPPSALLDLALVLLAAALPLLYTNRRSCSEVTIVVWAAMGIVAALTLHLAVYGWLARVSDVSFAMLSGLAVMLVQLAMRFRTLYEERRQLWIQKRVADEANELKSRFLAHMTHELRTPLTAIMGYNRLLAEPRVSDEQRLERAAVVDRNCGHLLELINNLLDQAKIEAGQMSVEPAATPVRGLLEDCRATLEPLAAGKSLSLEVACDGEVPEALSVDPLRLRQIVLNLAGNAIKFTERGGVWVEADWHQGRLSLRIRDSGPGMSEAALSRIFEAFAQADGTVARSHGGTGLGLTISRNLATLMNGTIQAASTPGEGTTFDVEVEAPRAVVERPAAPVPDSGDAPLDARVLLADDTEDIRELVGLHLRRLGVEVGTAADGREAVSRALEWEPDLVLMDVEMPGMTGDEAAVALRDAGYRGVILALTAHSDGAQMERLRAAGCDGVVPKPVSRDRLAAALREHLSGAG